ncbi:MAG: SURF1 family cytochrome oxidase biogenesis protein [Actinomycetota bacterium]
MWSVARRPRWIAALLFALALAATFAALSQWQLSRSVQNGTPVVRHTETVDELSAITKPQAGVTDKLDGQLVETSGHWVPSDSVLIGDRLNNGRQGWWVVTHFSAATTTGRDAGLPVAVGWSPTKAGASSALSDLRLPAGDVTITGRYNVSDAPSDSDFEAGQVTTVSSAALVNVWRSADAGGTYTGYLTLGTRVPGLTVIYSPPPVSDVQLDLLNVFYAVEWVVFAGFALFLWYRLVRDAWEREQEELAEQSTQLAEVN